MTEETIGKMVMGLAAAVGIIITAASIGLLLAFPIKWTWNATMPYLFSWPAITWGKAWCLNFLTGTLIKSNIIKLKG